MDLFLANYRDLRLTNKTAQRECAQNSIKSLEKASRQMHMIIVLHLDFNFWARNRQCITKPVELGAQEFKIVKLPCAGHELGCKLALNRPGFGEHDRMLQHLEC